MSSMNRRKAVIFDRDGTLFSVDGPMSPGDKEGWYNFNARIAFDAPVPIIHGLWHAIRPGIDRIIVSGRDGAMSYAMRSSFYKHDLFPHAFFQRNAGDRRKDSIVKNEIYVNCIEPVWDVLYVIDDRPQVVEMWRSHGLPVLQVTDPKILPPIGS